LNLGLGVLLLLALCGAAPSPEPGEEKVDAERLYRTHCAACHGVDGTGSGPRAGLLAIAPPDLTRLASRNRGRYPSRNVERIIDGRGHPRHAEGMPLWGDVFLDERDAYSEAKVRETIRQIVRYVATLQK
jgi:mono/diheme cytochrome c family protein